MTMDERTYWVYILANRRRTVYYVGITNDLARRMDEHRRHVVHGFTKRYNVDHLLYAELFATAYAAITREKEIKGWRREKKLDLIRQANPDLRDISGDM